MMVGERCECKEARQTFGAAELGGVWVLWLGDRWMGVSGFEKQSIMAQLLS